MCIMFRRLFLKFKFLMCKMFFSEVIQLFDKIHKNHNYFIRLITKIIYSCKECDNTGATCYSCMPYFLLNSNECQACPGNCSTCNSTDCIECAENFSLLNNECVECNIDNCKSCNTTNVCEVSIIRFIYAL